MSAFDRLLRQLDGLAERVRKVPPKQAARTAAARQLAVAAEYARKRPKLSDHTEPVLRKYARLVSAGKVDASDMKIEPGAEWTNSMIWLAKIGGLTDWQGGRSG